MEDVIWQLNVKQSNLTNHDWIHPNAKYHAFINDRSVCGKYGQDTSFFETNLKGPVTKEVACHKCMKILKLF